MNALDCSRALSASQSCNPGVTSVLLIVNPGSRLGSRALPAVLDALRVAGVCCEAVETTGRGHATSLIRDRISAEPQAFDAVFTLGGDGTAMEAATALADIPDAPPLGIIAVGTANVLARTLGIPLSPASAVSALIGADARSIDLGRVAGGPAFVIGLGIGLDAAMIGGASSMLKRRIGYAAYALSAIRAGLRLERFKVTLTIDGAVHRVEASSVLVANFGTVLGDMVCFGEMIDHQDGQLDVCIYSPRSLLDAGRIFWRMLLGGVSDDRCVRIIRGREVYIETDPARPTQADGELLGLTPVLVRVAPSAVRVLVPRAVPRRWRFRRAASLRMHTAPLETGTP